MERRLTVGAAETLSQASDLARRTLEGFAELEKRRQAEPTSSDRGSGPFDRLRSKQLPRAAIASRAELSAGHEWCEKVGYWTLASEIQRLIGEVNVQLTYSHGDPTVTMTPSLHSLRALAAEARDVEQRWSRSAPLAELETIRLAAIKVLTAVAGFHDEQVSMFQRLTPRTVQDGSFYRIGADIQSHYQPLIETMTPPVRSLYEASKAAMTEITSALR